ncbi:HNH endonuclease signature motif containing protein [soil metagenome]
MFDTGEDPRGPDGDDAANRYVGANEAELTARRLEAELAAACAQMHAATARVVGLVGEVLETGAWQAVGVRSAQHWVTWQCGVSAGRARSLVGMAKRLREELPVTRASFEAGELAEDQVATIARHIPAHNEAEAAEVARYATVAQLRRVYGRYVFAKPTPEPDPEPEPEPERRRVSFGYNDDGNWGLNALLAPDEGALLEKALDVARQGLFADEEDTAAGRERVSWADAFVAMADRSLASNAAVRPHRERFSVLIHLHDDPDSDGGGSARIHLGPRLDDAMRRYLLCDTKIRALTHTQLAGLSVGREQRTAPEATRRVIEHRDGGCRVPGCDRTKWLHIHHVTHWQDGGRTDTTNLIALCQPHHRAHHQGRLGITGADADHPDGITFTDSKGRPLTNRAPPAPPGDPPTVHPYRHPTGEPWDGHWLTFREPPPPTPPDLN